MSRSPRLSGVCAAGVLLMAAGSAVAQEELITFSFSDLSASFTNGVSMQDRVFRARAVAGGFQTGGDVSRVDINPAQTASFPTGFFGIGAANFEIEMNVDTVTIAGGGATTVAAIGMFTLVDVDGDQITGTLNGTWTDIGAGFDVFQGLISLGTITPSGAGDDSSFNGPGGGAFDYAGLPLSGLTGAFVQLQLTSGVFFNANFQNVSSQASGILVPAPAGAALLLGAGAMAGRRRRR